MEIIGAIALVAACLFIGFFLLKYAYIGALFLFAWAVEQGFIGAAVYVACWIFLFPFMLVAVLILGAKISWTN